MYFPLSWVELEWLTAVVPATDSTPTKLFLSPLMVFVFGICSFIRPNPGVLSCSSSNSSSHSPWVNLLSVQISSPPLSQHTALAWCQTAKLVLLTRVIGSESCSLTAEILYMDPERKTIINQQNQRRVTFIIAFITFCNYSVTTYNVLKDN